MRKSGPSAGGTPDCQELRLQTPESSRLTEHLLVKGGLEEKNFALASKRAELARPALFRAQIGAFKSLQSDPIKGLMEVFWSKTLCRAELSPLNRHNVYSTLLIIVLAAFAPLAR